VLIYIPDMPDEEWDKQLRLHNDAEKSFVSYRPYHELKNNCYDYIIRFLNGIKFEGKEDHTSKDIVERFIRTTFPVPFFLVSLLNSNEFLERSVSHFESYFALWKEVSKKGSYVAG